MNIRHLLCATILCTQMGLNAWSWVSIAKNIISINYKACLPVSFARDSAVLSVKLRRTKEIPDNVKQFILKELEAAGIDIQKITLVQHECARESCGAMVFFNTIVLEPELIVLLEKLLDAELTQADQATLSIVKGILHHEANHLKNNDSQRFLLGAVLVSIITHYGIEYALYSLQSQASDFNTDISNQSWKAIFLKGILKMFVSQTIFSAHKRYAEQKADDGIIDSAEHLEGFSKFLYNLRNLSFSDCAQAGIPNWLTQLLHDNIFVNALSLASHPTFNTRINKLEQRILNLKIQETEACDQSNFLKEELMSQTPIIVT